MPTYMLLQPTLLDAVLAVTVGSASNGLRICRTMMRWCHGIKKRRSSRAALRLMSWTLGVEPDVTSQPLMHDMLPHNPPTPHDKPNSRLAIAIPVSMHTHTLSNCLPQLAHAGSAAVSFSVGILVLPPSILGPEIYLFGHPQVIISVAFQELLPMILLGLDNSCTILISYSSMVFMGMI